MTATGSPPPSPPPAAPPPWTPPKAKSSKGCIAVFVVLVLILGGGVVALVITANHFSASIDTAENKAGNLLSNTIGSPGPCPFLKDADASAVLGPGTVAHHYTGFIGEAFDFGGTTVMPSAPWCAIETNAALSPDRSEDDPTTVPTGSIGLPDQIGRVDEYIGSDAPAQFERELAQARSGIISNDPRHPNPGNTSTPVVPYFAKTVLLADEAFCTSDTVDGSSGVLARKGNALVYVALIADLNRALGIAPDPSHPSRYSDDANCTLGQLLAKKILRLQ